MFFSCVRSCVCLFEGAVCFCVCVCNCIFLFDGAFVLVLFIVVQTKLQFLCQSRSNSPFCPQDVVTSSCVTLLVFVASILLLGSVAINPAWIVVFLIVIMLMVNVIIRFVLSIGPMLLLHNIELCSTLLINVCCVQ